jgi:hypothetical protein
MPTCMIKQELLDQIARVSKAKAALQKSELEAVLAGTTDTEVELGIDNARALRQVLIGRLRHHIAAHGC